MTYALLFAVLPFLALLGAWASLKFRSGRNGFFFLLPLDALLNGTAWAGIVKTTRLPLTAAAILFDVIYSTSYFLALVKMGEPASLTNWIGVGCAVAAFILLSL